MSMIRRPKDRREHPGDALVGWRTAVGNDRVAIAPSGMNQNAGK